MNMKSRILVFAALMALAAGAFGQSEAQKSSDAQKSFDKLKTLAGAWQGTVSTDMKDDHSMEGAKIQLSMRVTSRGNSIVHEMRSADTPDDPAKYDHPVTMMYMDGERLMLTHYCDAGNRPRMSAKVSPDGKTVDFDFVDVSGSTEMGHMQHATFTFVDADHHSEEWTYLMPGDKPMHARMDLVRAK
jgi:hypothetical protein